MEAQTPTNFSNFSKISTYFLHTPAKLPFVLKTVHRTMSMSPVTLSYHLILHFFACSLSPVWGICSNDSMLFDLIQENQKWRQLHKDKVIKYLHVMGNSAVILIRSFLADQVRTYAKLTVAGFI
ncbi:hypothetical protein BofuT4_P064590.1 [Botrytis cinerea T4]|uniref:Uncharacterized protein n=1 Tax=Botryotinia fuckeliana (strain T4) TaxID=999810 RepID=G2XSI0_BOTF4|nr:hypothetical protein BofuT4_P064590.1 [Botrytis cinerea T4]